HHHLVQRILDDAGAPGGLQLRDDVADGVLFQDGIYGDPLGVAEWRNRRAVQRWENRKYGRKVFRLHVEHQAHSTLRRDCTLQQERDVLNFVALGRVLPRLLVGDELRIGLEKRLDDAQTIGF